MAKKPMSTWYAEMGFEMTNVQWSWGASTADGRAHMLRSWSNQTKRIDDYKADAVFKLDPADLWIEEATGDWYMPADKAPIAAREMATRYAN